MVEAAGVGLCVSVENKQLIDSKDPLETQETANTRFSSTLQVHGIRQSSRVSPSVPNQNTDQACREAIGAIVERTRKRALRLSGPLLGGHDTGEADQGL